MQIKKSVSVYDLPELVDTPKKVGPWSISHYGWRLGLLNCEAKAKVLATYKGAEYLLGPKVGPVDLGVFAADHFLNYPTYKPRKFLTAFTTNVLTGRNSKAIIAPGHGLIDEFNMGGVAAAAGLLESDFEPGGEERRTQRVAGLSVPLIHYGGETFGHFILDGLLQLFIFRELLAKGEAKIAHWPLGGGWMDDALTRCGAPAPSRRVLSQSRVIFETAALSSALAAHGVYFPNSQSIEFFEWIKRCFSLKGLAGRQKLYVVRKHRHGRRIYNQAELITLLERRGFCIVDPDKETLQAQMRLFSAAQTVVSAWGSGLTLSPLLSGARRVVELLPSNVTDPWFLRQAAVHGLDYRPALIHANEVGDGVVDLGQLERLLDCD